jgi:hypothetical protein
MDSSDRTPLLDLFHRGEVTAEVRMVAARGELVPRPHDQLALLVLLARDEDEQISAAARQTMACIASDRLAAFLARPDVPDEIRAYFRERAIEPGPTPAEDSAELLVQATREGTPQPARATAEAEQQEDDAEATAQRLAKLSVGERIKRAMLGTREERYILIRDVNRMVSAAVLSSPKISESDIDMFARMGNVSEDVLRTIGNSRAWMKRYSVVSSLALNPKTPIAVSLGLVGRLIERDLKTIARDRNMQEPLRAAARRLLVHADERRK